MINQTRTAAESYVQSKQEGIIMSKNKLVFDFIKANQPCSNKDIELGTGLDNTSVGCARWHLMQQNKIRLCGFKINKGTDREVEAVEVNPHPEIVFKTKSDKQKLDEIRELCESVMSAQFFDKNYSSHIVLADDILQIINS